MVRTSVVQSPPGRVSRSQSAAARRPVLIAPPLGGDDNGAGPAPRSPPPGPPLPPPVAPAHVMADRCKPCKDRGQFSKCDKAWPVCSKCIREDTEARCFHDPNHPPVPRANPPLAPHADPPPAPRAEPPITPRAPPRPLPTPIRSPVTPDLPPRLPPRPPSTVRGGDDRSSVPSRQASPARAPFRLPLGVRQRSPAPIVARLRAPVFLDAEEERRRIAASIEEMEARIARARAQMEFLAAPLPGKHAPLSLPGAPPRHSPHAGAPHVVELLGRAYPHLPLTHGGHAPMLSTLSPHPPPHGGHAFMLPHTHALTRFLDPPTNREAHRPSGLWRNPTFLLYRNTWLTSCGSPAARHVSMGYFTDAYNGQASTHGALTTYRTRVDPTTGQNIVEAAPLPDLGEARMTYASYTGAFQRFVSVLDALGNPLVDRWRLHAAHIHLRPEIVHDWPLVLSYCIAIRRRSVHDHALDPGTFQSKIFEDCRVKYQEQKMMAFIRTASAPSAPRLDRPLARALPAPVGGPDPATRPLRDAGICFACGGKHPSKGCANPPVLVTKDAGGSWLLHDRTPAPSVAPTVTQPRPAVADPRAIVTPLIADAWEQLLTEHGLISDFKDLPPGLCRGFDIGVSPSPLACTTIHPNHKSAVDRPTVITEHIAKEIRAGRYTGPFAPDILYSRIGHFRASPLGVVDNPSSPGSFRIIQDFSFPVANPVVPSVNSEIDTSRFPCLWGFFPDTVDVLVSLPVGAQAATFDVDAAYRRIPIRIEDQVHTVVHWNGECWVDHCVPFGAASSNGLFGRCGDALLRICEARGLGPVLKWVDDFLFFRIPVPGSSPPAYTYSEADVYALANFLGLPWKLAKSVPFAFIFRYIGFDWDIPGRRVSVPPEKRAKFLHKLREWCSSRTVSLKSTESLVGSLAHCAWAVPEGRARVAGLSRFLSTFSRTYRSRFALHEPSKWARADAAWWEDRLATGDCGSSLRPTPPPSPLRCFMDASSSFGIGILLDGHYAMWRLKDGWHTAGRDIGWAEFVAVELALDAIISRSIRDASVTLHSDNQGVIGAIKAGRSHNMQQNCVLQRVMAKSLATGLHLRIHYVATDENPADAPSRGRPDPSSRRLSDPPSPDEFVADWLVPV